MGRIDRSRLPKHIAIIMDGNGRWAAERGLPRILGHRAGVEAVRRVVETGTHLGIQVLTLYAFSSENWSRPRREINALMRLLREYLNKEIEELNRNNIKLDAIGRIRELPPEVKKTLARARQRTGQNTGLRLNLALNYGGRSEIVDALKKICSEIQKEKGRIQQIDENFVSSHLYTAGLPDPDLLIRTSGEMRISNFLLWQSSYSEFYFTPKLWPDFTGEDLKQAIVEYQRRERRYGRSQKR